MTGRGQSPRITSIAVAVLSERLFHELESLDKGLGLEMLIDARQTELKKYQQSIVSAKKEHESLQGTIAALEQQKAALEANIKTASEKVNDEIVKVIPAAREAAQPARQGTPTRE